MQASGRRQMHQTLLPSASHLYRGEWEEKKSSIKTEIIEQLAKRKIWSFGMFKMWRSQNLVAKTKARWFIWIN